LRLLERQSVGENLVELAGVFEEESNEWEKIEKMIYADRLKNDEKKLN